MNKEKYIQSRYIYRFTSESDARIISKPYHNKQLKEVVATDGHLLAIFPDKYFYKEQLSEFYTGDKFPKYRSEGIIPKRLQEQYRHNINDIITRCEKMPLITHSIKCGICEGDGNLYTKSGKIVCDCQNCTDGIIDTIPNVIPNSETLESGSSTIAILFESGGGYYDCNILHQIAQFAINHIPGENEFLKVMHHTPTKIIFYISDVLFVVMGTYGVHDNLQEASKRKHFQIEKLQQKIFL